MAFVSRCRLWCVGLGFAAWTVSACAAGEGLPALGAGLAAVAGALALVFGVLWARRAQRRETHIRAELAAALEESARFGQMIEGANAVAWEFEPASGRCTYVSAQAESLLGYPERAWRVPGFWRESVHADDRDFVVDFFRTQTELGYDHELEYRMQHEEGHVVFVRDMRTLLRDAAGTVVRVRSLLVNLTSHKATEVALEDSEARFRSTFEQAAVGMALCSLAGRYLRVNRRYSQITGFSEAELLLRDSRDLTHPEDRERNLELLAALTHTPGEVRSFEKRLLRPDGSVVWIYLTVSVVRSMRREPTQFMEVIEDITQRKLSEAVLRESESRLRTILTSLDEGIVMLDAEGAILVSNDAAARVYGLAPDAFQAGRPFDGSLKFLGEDGRVRAPESLPPARALQSARAQRETLAYPHPDGQMRWLWTKSEPLCREEDGRVYAVVTTVSDITNQRQTEDELRLAATVFDNSVEAILVADSRQCILRVNRAFTEVTGYAAAEVIGQSAEILVASRRDSSFYQSIMRAIELNGYWQGEFSNTRKNGTIYPEWLSMSAVHDESGAISHYVAVFSDVTERRANEARIAYLAHHDPLTGLPNRTLLQDRLHQALVRANRERSMVGVLFLDLDRFKTINDSLGHPAGDRLLLAVAERIRTCVRESDTVCRQGGDEFIVVLQDLADAEAPARVADKILSRLSEPFDIDGHRIGTSFSIGISVFPTDGRDVDTLMRNADTAMYHAKEGGRDTYRFFAEAMNTNALERLQLENSLRQAVERKELMLYYQPQISLEDGCIVGAEALIRWNSPLLGFIPPGRFIPIAEESGLIVPIGRWVLREACEQARRWVAEGLPPITVAVNLSALQFRRDDIVEAVSQVLAETGQPPELLELELTESLLMDNVEEVMVTVKRLKSLGVRLSIDDFGTGYSSLSYLKRFEVDRLKIDQSFVRDVPFDQDDAAIVRAIIQLGGSLKLEVIAEGAETEAQVEFLKGEGCREAQGYYYCRPVESGVFADLLRRRVIQPGLPAAKAALTVG